MTTYLGTSSSNSIVAVEGDNTGGGTGVKGVAAGAGGSGVVAQITALSGGGQALYANSSSPGANAIFAEGVNKGIQTNAYATSNAIAIHGWAANSGSFASNNIGVLGEGDTYGIQGSSTNGYGVNASSTSSFAINASSTSSYGIVATSTNYCAGSFTSNFSGTGLLQHAIQGYNFSSAPTAFFQNYGTTASVIYCTGGAYSLEAHGAGYFSGYVTKAGGGYQVDHPSDPENKLLNHCFVESPEMKNVYDGDIILDMNGSAVVQMPNYFEAANSNYHYQLTAIGVAAPDLHVFSEISNGQFVIAGGKSEMKVSWQVTGVRSDKWALANHPGVEIDKKEPGFFMHPELFGFDKSRGLDKIARAKLKQ